MKKNLRVIYLAIVAMMMLSTTAVAQTATFKRGATAEEETLSFTEATDTDAWLTSERNLSDATEITLTGTWNATQLACLRASIKNSTEINAPNSTLNSVDMSGVVLTGGFDNSNTNGMCYLFRNCADLETVVLPAGKTDSAIWFYYTFRGCAKLSTLTNMEQFTNVTNWNTTFYNCTSLRELRIGTKLEAGASLVDSNTLYGLPYAAAIFLTADSEIPTAWDEHKSSYYFYIGNTLTNGDNFPPMVIVNGTGTGVDFTNATATAVFTDLSAATSLTLTGVWNATQMAGLRASIKNQVASENAIADKNPSVLESIDMSAVRLSGSFPGDTKSTIGFALLFRHCSKLHTITLPAATVDEEVSLCAAFSDCPKLTTIHNLDKFTRVTNFNRIITGSPLVSFTLPAGTNYEGG